MAKKKKQKKKKSQEKEQKVMPVSDEAVEALEDELLDSMEETPSEETTDQEQSKQESKKQIPTVAEVKEEAVKKKQARAPRQNIGEELIEVYEASGDDLTSVTTLEHKRRSWQRMLVFILWFLVAVFIGVAAISWLIWGGRQEFTGEQVNFEITTTEELASGAEIEYEISYANYESVNFGKSEIELRYPSGFVFESAEPEPTSNSNLWDLGSLNPGANDSIKVKGRLVGEPESDSTVSGVFRYWPANFSSEFQEIASAQTMINPIDLTFRFEGSDQILVGQSTSYSFVLKNETENDINNLRLELVALDEFVVNERTPETENDYWDIESISSEEELEFQINGAFSSAVEDSVKIIGLLSQQGADEDSYFKQKEHEIETNLIEGDLIVNLIANGQTRNSSVQWGETVNMTLSYQNNSETVLSDLNAVTTIEARYRSNDAEGSSDGAVDFQGIVDANNGAVKVIDRSDEKSLHVRTITWNGDDLDSLGELDPDQEDEISIQFPLLTANQALESLNHAGDVELILKTEMTIGKTGSVEEEITVASNVITLALNTDLLLDAHSRYYDEEGEALGDGPLPPRINETTTYRAQLNLSNKIHEVQDIIVSMQLPSNVDWVNSYDVSAGEVDYNESNSELTWRLNKMPLDVNNVTLSFDLALTPSESQVNEVAALTKKMTMTATDAITGGKIIQTVSGLTTGIERDDKGSDKGLVTD